jgi:hypothetical protein
MSLLNKGMEPCTVYLEEVVTDMDGNTRTRPSTVGIEAMARFQVQGQSGTSARRAEQDNEGYTTEKVYRVRFPRSFPHILGAQSQIEWRGQRWAVFGDVSIYSMSPRTAHVTYVIKRF